MKLTEIIEEPLYEDPRKRLDRLFEENPDWEKEYKALYGDQAGQKLDSFA